MDLVFLQNLEEEEEVQWEWGGFSKEACRSYDQLEVKTNKNTSFNTHTLYIFNSSFCVAYLFMSYGRAKIIIIIIIRMTVF